MGAVYINFINKVPAKLAMILNYVCINVLCWHTLKKVAILLKWVIDFS